MISETLVVVITVVAVGFFLLFVFSMPLYHLALRAQAKALELQKRYAHLPDNNVNVGDKQQ